MYHENSVPEAPSKWNQWRSIGILPEAAGGAQGVVATVQGSTRDELLSALDCLDEASRAKLATALQAGGGVSEITGLSNAAVQGLHVMKKTGGQDNGDDDGNSPHGMPMKVAMLSSYSNRVNKPTLGFHVDVPTVNPDLAVGDGPFECRWHDSASAVGILSEDGHTFTKMAGPRKKRLHGSGVGHYELSTICMIFDSSLRCGGDHAYHFSFMDGELGLADGAGFVFDTRLRRRPLQQLRAVFLNQRGYVCLRKGQQVSKLPVQLPKLCVGMQLTLFINLDNLSARFTTSDDQGHVKGTADINLDELFDDMPGWHRIRSGFFCALVSGGITVALS
jgi:hypothetical protein